MNPSTDGPCCAIEKGSRPGEGRRFVVPLTCVALLVASSGAARAVGSCFEFFQNLAPGTTGSCADVAFFGFGFSTDFGCANGGVDMAEVDLFDDITPVPDFFDPAAPVFASVEVNAAGTTGLMAFSIEHRGAITMFPLTSDPGAGNPSDRFITTGSQNKTIFRAHNTTPGTQQIVIEIDLFQYFELEDPIDSAIDAEIGTFFLLDLAELESGDLIEELVGSSLFDSENDLEPEFDDPFADGYNGFTTTTVPTPGRANVEFRRTLSTTIDEDLAIELESLSSQNIFADGFESGDTAAWTMSSPDTFVFRVSSPDPNVTFTLELGSTAPEVVIPALRVDEIPGDRIRLSWDALDTQTYTVIFTTDLAGPRSLWQERATVAGATGEVTRDFPISGSEGFFALRVTLP